METFLALLMALGIFVGIPIIIAYAIIGVYRFKVLHVRVPRTGEVVEEVKPLEHRGVQLTILVLFCVYYPISYYFGEIVKHFGWEALRWDFFYTVHDIHRVAFLVPILFAAYCFRIKGAVITTLFAIAVFLPRTFLFSQYPDPMSRMLVFIIFALGFGIFVGTLVNKIERLQHSIDSINRKS